jgi:hypothetical protein
MFVIAGALIGGLLNFTVAAALVLIGLGLWQLIKVLLGQTRGK